MSAGLPPRTWLNGSVRPTADGPRGRGRLLRSAICVLTAMLLLSGCGSIKPIKAPGRNVGTQLDARIPKAIGNLAFTDSTGRVRRLSDFAGKVLVISDGMTLCQETCPLDTTTVVQTARQLDADGYGAKVQFVTITVDPVRDTVPQIAAYRKLYTSRSGAPANWTVMTGSSANIKRLWKYLGVYIKKVPQGNPPPKNWRTGKTLTYDVEHSDEVFFLDGKGNERFILEGAPVVQNKSDIPKVMYHFLTKHGRQKVGHPEATDWTEGQALQVLSWLLNKRVSSSSR